MITIAHLEPLVSSIILINHVSQTLIYWLFVVPFCFQDFDILFRFKIEIHVFFFATSLINSIIQEQEC